jgi:hypothetical protein
VLECSGPVPWALKKSVYGKAAARPELHQALFRGIYAGCYGVYGSLDPSAALTILRRLELPEDYEGFDRLKAELNSRAR